MWWAVCVSICWWWPIFMLWGWWSDFDSLGSRFIDMWLWNWMWHLDFNTRFIAHFLVIGETNFRNEPIRGGRN